MGSGGPTASHDSVKGVFLVMFLSSGWWMNVGRPADQSKMCEKEKMWTPQEIPNAGIMLKLTFHLQDDWLRLYHSGADAQPAAILPSIPSLHMLNAVTQYMRTHVKLRNQPVTSFFTSTRHIPDSGEESCDPVGGGLELVDHRL